MLPISHIWFRLVLPEYSCPNCERPENESEAAANDKMFTNAMVELLQALALLGPELGSLTLEFSAHSPSGSAHFLQSWYELRPDYPHFTTPEHCCRTWAGFGLSQRRQQRRLLFHQGT